MIDDVNVKIAVTSAAGPDETVEALDLIRDLGNVLWLDRREAGGHRRAFAIAAHQYDFAQLTAMDAISQLLQMTSMTGHETHAHFQVLGGSLVCQIEHPAAKWGRPPSAVFP